MLVLSRRSGESVVVGGADRFHRLLKVRVLEIRGTSVKLGFEADPGVPVHREELWERINGKCPGESLTERPVPTTQ
jgi:carbon storage regulator CsrA